MAREANNLGGGNTGGGRGQKLPDGVSNQSDIGRIASQGVTPGKEEGESKGGMRIEKREGRSERFLSKAHSENMETI